MKRRVVKKLLCVTISSTMLLANSAVLTAADEMSGDLATRQTETEGTPEEAALSEAGTATEEPAVISETPEPAAPAAQETPQSTQSIQVPEETPEPTETPQTPGEPETTEEVQTPAESETTEEPEATEDTGTSQEPEATEDSEATEDTGEVQEPETPEETEEPQDPGITEETTTEEEATEKPEEALKPENTVAPEAPKAPQASAPALSYSGTQGITAGTGFYLDELEEKYHLSFSKDFAEMIKEIEREYMEKAYAAVQEEMEGEDEQVKLETPYLLKMASLVEESEGREEILELAEEIEEVPEESETITEETAQIQYPDLEFTGWQDTLAVYLLTEQREGEKEFTIDRSDKEELSDLFANMNTADVKEDQWTITSVSAAQYAAQNFVDLSDEEVEFLELYTSDECSLLCAAATGSEGFLESSLGDGVSGERAQVVAAAYSLVGKVSYFWGGKSSVIGWDSRWGNIAQITAAGISDTGSFAAYGLDCSGFVTWAFINGYENKSVSSKIGHGTASQWARSVEITEEEALPGDLVFLQAPSASGINHVGIVVGKDNDGNLIAVHCNAGDDNVVVESAYEAGFRYVRRPLLYME